MVKILRSRASPASWSSSMIVCVCCCKMIVVTGQDCWEHWRLCSTLHYYSQEHHLRDSGSPSSSSLSSTTTPATSPPQSTSLCSLSSYRSTPLNSWSRRSCLVWGMWCTTTPGSPVSVVSWPTLPCCLWSSSSPGPGQSSSQRVQYRWLAASEYWKLNIKYFLRFFSPESELIETQVMQLKTGDDDHVTDLGDNIENLSGNFQTSLDSDNSSWQMIQTLIFYDQIKTFLFSTLRLRLWRNIRVLNLWENMNCRDKNCFIFSFSQVILIKIQDETDFIFSCSLPGSATCLHGESQLHLHQGEQLPDLWYDRGAGLHHCQGTQSTH